MVINNTFSITNEKAYEIVKEDIIMLPKGEKIAKTLAKYGFIG